MVNYKREEINMRPSISASEKTAARSKWRRCGFFGAARDNYQLFVGKRPVVSHFSVIRALGAHAFRQETTDRNGHFLYSSSPNRLTQSKKYRVGDGIFWDSPRSNVNVSLVIMRLASTCYCCRAPTKKKGFFFKFPPQRIPYRLVFQDHRPH